RASERWLADLRERARPVRDDGVRRRALAHGSRGGAERSAGSGPGERHLGRRRARALAGRGSLAATEVPPAGGGPRTPAEAPSGGGGRGGRGPAVLRRRGAAALVARRCRRGRGGGPWPRGCVAAGRGALVRRGRAAARTEQPGGGRGV